MSTQNKGMTIHALMTEDGFIEIKGLKALDEIVGGLGDPEAIVCELVEEVASEKRTSE